MMATWQNTQSSKISMQLMTHPVLCAFMHNHMMMMMMVMVMTMSTMMMISVMMMMMMMLTMPTGSDTESGFYIGRWMERPVVNHFRVFLLRLSIIITVIYDHFDL